jgi:hypothetical protein
MALVPTTGANTMAITTQAIETKFIKATNVTGERIKASAWGGSVTGCHALAVCGTDLYAGLGGQEGTALVYKWNATNWEAVGAFPGDRWVYSLTTFDNKVYAGTGVLIGQGDLFVYTGNDPFAFTTGVCVDASFTMSFWVNLRSTTEGTLASRYFGTVNKRMWWFRIYQSAPRMILSNPTETAYLVRIATNSIASLTNTWQNLTVVYDGSEAVTGISIYRNGPRIDNSSATAGTYTGMTYQIDIPMSIGGNVSYNSYLNGIMGESFMFTSALDPASVTNLWIDTKSRYGL